jgi:hypothetical protein
VISIFSIAAFHKFSRTRYRGLLSLWSSRRIARLKVAGLYRLYGAQSPENSVNCRRLIQKEPAELGWVFSRGKNVREVNDPPSVFFFFFFFLRFLETLGDSRKGGVKKLL